MDSQSIASSTSDVPREVLELLRWYDRTLFQPYGMPRQWPGLVGDTVERASAIVRYGTPYHVVTQPYKGSIHRSLVDPLRVILYLDEHGYVAVTPKIG